ncbi:PLP-dependent transferase, partial [Campylobacter jejuni]|uniref:PLP-dependent transferase n=1 Tax=Campylobacter jejuni TaxID=197 RepID=UPI0018F877B9
AMITIDFADGYCKDDAINFVVKLEYFSICASWGGYESLATVTTSPRTATDWSARVQFVRFHICLEDTKDLIADLTQAFDSIKK